MSIAISSQCKETHNKFLFLFAHITRVVNWYCKVVHLIVSNQMRGATKLRVYVELLKKFTNACESISADYLFLE